MAKTERINKCIGDVERWFTKRHEITGYSLSLIILITLIIGLLLGKW